MSKIWANEFGEIFQTLVERLDLREAILKLIDEQPIPGKVTEGGNRLSTFRLILKRLIKGEISLSEAYARIEVELPRSGSFHSGNNRVFADGWAERLVRTQLSRFYNQAVMEQLISEGYSQCYVPHSSAEEPGSKCSMYLAGNTQDVKVLYDRLINSYARGNWNNEVKIPERVSDSLCKWP
jgi:hypothetical protein